MPSPTIEEALANAKEAVRFSRDVREYHGRRTPAGTPQREADLKEAQEKVARAMQPIRSFRGRSPFEKQTNTRMKLNARVAKASQALQAERRKLWKMINTPKAKKKETT